MNNQKAAIYCRLSKDDEQNGDSVSIETQRMMLTKYCIDHNFEIFDIYIDDGYSGLNFNRPGFKRLIQDLEEGLFNIVITKDLSRFGRDYIQTGYYIDIFFVTKRIRYIAVNDGIDTAHENNDIAPFKNILNDMYAKDLSRKVKSAKLQRAQNGLYISAQPPFGYKVDPLNRNHLIVDTEAANVVKLIFNLAKLGNSYSEISRRLTTQNILTPAAYKVMNGDTRFLRYADNAPQTFEWPYQTVKAILTNPIYVGDMVNHKVEVINYKTKERVRIPTEQQIVVENTHEAIIDRDTFNTINQRLLNRRQPNHNINNVFKGLVFCEECGEQLQLILKKTKQCEQFMFRCPLHAKSSRECTKNHFIYYDILIDETKKQLINSLNKIINSNMTNDLYETILFDVCEKIKTIQQEKIQKELMLINKQIRECIKTSFVNATSNELSVNLNHLYKKRELLLQGLINSTQTFMLKPQIIFEKNKDYLFNIIRNCLLDEKNISHFIERIEVGHLERNTLNIKQRLIFHFKFKMLP